jgi:molecular chaperone DnaK (HSP70)
MKIIGIDLGTSNCCISYIDEQGKMEIIRDTEYSNSITMPSIVNVENDLILVGHEIDKNHINYNKNVFHSFKRLIGHTIDDIHTTNLREILNYEIDSLDDQIICKDENGKSYHLIEIIYLLLKKIHNLISDHIGDEEWQCIVTVPAYFNELQRQITMDAINLSKLPIIKLLNEPTAASYAYLYHNNILYEQSFSKKILVIDFGAGTLDLTILEIEKDNDDIDDMYCEVLGIYGDNNFGGIDITKKIYNTMFKDDDIDINIKMNICESIKIMLSSQSDVTYHCNELDKTFNYAYDVFFLQLEVFCKKIIDIIDNLLTISDLKTDDIDDIILVGGSFKIPFFRKEIAEYFKKTINQIRVKVSNVEHLLYEDIAVSLGASVYGYFSNMSKNVVLIDRLPLSIGIETKNNEITKIIERNTIIPIKQVKMFTPEKHGEEFVDINIYQGESLFTKNCQLIGNFRLLDIPKNHPTIFVTIAIDMNGLITIMARDKRSDVNEYIKIESKKISLSDEEIDNIMSKYEISILDEQLYKKVITNFYTLINFIDKISYQLNFNSTLKLTDEVKNIIKKDIEMIILKMNNKYIVEKYKINTNLIQKCIIINDLEFVDTSSNELTCLQIEQFDKLLVQLKYYLVDRYEVYLLSEEDDMVTAQQVSKLEALDDNDENIDKNLYETKNYNDVDSKKAYTDQIDSIINKKTVREEYEILCLELLENIDTFDLLTSGVKILQNKLANDVKEYNNEQLANEINEINELCIYLINSHKKS